MYSNLIGGSWNKVLVQSTGTVQLYVRYTVEPSYVTVVYTVELVYQHLLLPLPPHGCAEG